MTKINGKLIIAEFYAHPTTGNKLEDIRDDELHDRVFLINRLEISPEFGTYYLGNFLTGLGCFDVVVPVQHSRFATDSEKEQLVRGRFAAPHGTFMLALDEFL